MQDNRGAIGSIPGAARRPQPDLGRLRHSEHPRPFGARPPRAWDTVDRSREPTA